VAVFIYVLFGVSSRISRTTQESSVKKRGKITRKFGTYANSISDFCNVLKVLTILGVFVKLRNATISLPARPPGTTLLLMDRFSRNLVFEYFSQIWREKSVFIKLWQE